MPPTYKTLSAKVQIINEFDKPLSAYDDGTGPLWLIYDSLGVTGVIRADTYEDAYGIAEDEFFPEADEATWEAIAEEFDCTNIEDLGDDPIFQENYGFRPNGANLRDVHGHGIYKKDVNVEGLVKLTQAVMEVFRLRVVLA